MTMSSLGQHWGHQIRIRTKHLVRKRRGTALLMCGVLAATAGILSVVVLAKNRPAAGALLDRFGYVYRVALPKGVTRLEDIRIFEVVPLGADDFLRAELNGHVVANSEDTWSAILPEPTPQANADTKAWELTRDYVVDRRTLLMSRKSVELALVRGWNHLVVELENYRGPCSGGVQLFVNEQPIIGVPTSLPLRDDQSKPRLVPKAHQEHALCARVAYQFELD
jgi:hypothetical protein